jgi:hypothetical protein
MFAASAGSAGRSCQAEQGADGGNDEKSKYGIAILWISGEFIALSSR